MIKKIIPILIMFFLFENVYAILDPSIVYCEQMGYIYAINKTSKGEQGICIFPDGNSVEAWSFLKGTAGQEYTYCREEGYVLKIINDSEECSSIFSYDCAVCVKEDEEIEVTRLMNLSFAEGICGDGVCIVEEDYLTCPRDCPSGQANGFCDRVGDGRCDPDCRVYEDSDCLIKKIREYRTSLILVGILIVLIILGMIIWRKYTR